MHEAPHFHHGPWPPSGPGNTRVYFNCDTIPLGNGGILWKTYETKDIRNVGIVGHGHCGKTSAVAGLLFAAGATNRLTRVDEGNTVTDFDEEEINRKLTISTAIAATEWRKTKVNLLDTPGFNMFLNDARSALIAADAAIVVVDAVAGVEPQTEKMWNTAEEYGLPRAIVINKAGPRSRQFRAHHGQYS